MSDTPLVQIDIAAVTALYDRAARESTKAGVDAAHRGLFDGMEINQAGLRVADHVHQVVEAFNAALEQTDVSSAVLAPREVRIDQDGQPELFGHVTFQLLGIHRSGEFYAVIAGANSERPRNTHVEVWTSPKSGPTMKFDYHPALGAHSHTFLRDAIINK
jgi:hypothetical protein